MCHFADSSDDAIADEPTSWVWVVEYVAHDIGLNMLLAPFVHTAFFTAVFVPFSAVGIDFITVNHTDENIIVLAEKSF